MATSPEVVEGCLVVRRFVDSNDTAIDTADNSWEIPLQEKSRNKINEK